MASTNPFRYRGYYYDAETELYYLQSRYYDAETGRFLSTDDWGTLSATPTDLTDKNLYAYCDNNPIVRIDQGGYLWDFLLDLVSIAVSVYDVITNPTSGEAWMSLGADIACAAVPGLTGGGNAIRAANKVDDVVDAIKVVDKVDGVADTVKTGWKVGDDITALTKAGKEPSWTALRQRYWKNEALYRPYSYSQSDLKRMRKGLAAMGSDNFPMELHHPYGRSGQNFYIFEPLSRQQHQDIHKVIGWGR